MSKRQFAIVILIVLVVFCGFWIGASITSNYAIEQINLITEDLNKESKLRHEVEDKLDVTYVKLQIETEKAAKLNEELESAKITILNLKSDKYELRYIGDYKLTHYCTEQREHICGTGTGFTATGTQATAGRTVAIDPTVIPYGTEMYIEGYGWRVAEDTGGAVNGNQIDIAVSTHEQAVSMGTATGGVWILVKRNS